MIHNHEFQLLDYKGQVISAAGYDITFRRLLSFFSLHINWLRYLNHWYKTLTKYKNESVIDLCIPWYNYGANHWVRKYVNNTMKIFEYGTGGSTLFYSRCAAELISVEHNKEWYDKMLEYLREPNNVTLYLEEPIRMDHQNKTSEYISKTFKEYHNYSFENYVKTIEKYPNNYFDLVVIDGRCRPMCLLTSFKKVKKGGWILFDNSERLHYQDSMNTINYNYKIDFYGFGPFLKYFWRTTVMKI